MKDSSELSDDLKEFLAETDTSSEVSEKQWWKKDPSNIKEPTVFSSAGSSVPSAESTPKLVLQKLQNITSEYKDDFESSEDDKLKFFADLQADGKFVDYNQLNVNYDDDSVVEGYLVQAIDGQMISSTIVESKIDDCIFIII